MRLSILTQLAALSTAIVIPNEEVFQEIQIESHRTLDTAINKIEHSFDDLFESVDSAFDKVSSNTKDALNRVTKWTSEAQSNAEDRLDSTYFAGKNWLSSAVDNAKYCAKEDISEGLNALGIKDYSQRPRHGGHHHHHKPNLTVYELIAKSKYTTKLAKLISEHDDLVKLLNGTSANFTVFAPTDRAFEKIPKHHPKPSKEQIKALLSYHVSDDFYPAGRVLTTRTIPTLLDKSKLGKGNPQRLATEVGFKGLTVNFYSRVVAVNIFGTNGVIHGVDSILVPPPTAYEIINFLPSEFSTLNLALTKTGLDKTLNTTRDVRGTVFAPSNWAFSKLGPRVNGFLFSKYGEKYLKALLQYHIVPETVLYSDAVYNAPSKKDDHHGPPRGVFHITLPTLLKDRSLSIDIARWGRLIEIKINAFARVAVSDGVAKDGVIHVVGDVLIPPKKLGSALDKVDADISVDELRARLDPYIDSSNEEDADWEINEDEGFTLPPTIEL